MFQQFRNRRLQLLAAKWLILAVLAWSQLAFAVHRADHQAADLVDTCTICAQFDRFGDAPVDVVDNLTAAPSPETIVQACDESFTAQQSFSLFRARASP
jgi:hypothetical protein